MDQDRLVPLLIGLLLAAWMMAAAWAVLTARSRQKRAENQLRSARRLGRMVEESPALPLLVRSDGRIEASPRLAQWLGLDGVPQFLSELDTGERGLPTAKLEELTEAVRRTQKTAAPFRMVLTPRGSSRSLALRGHLADPQISPGGAALVWVFDFSDSETELTRLRDEASRARGDFTALVSLIEAAPMPMWFRRPDGELQLVNSAYVAAVGGDSAQGVVASGTELIENVDGLTPAQVARAASDKGAPIQRIVSTTINGQRRAMRVSDLPLGEDGVAGYAVDIEDLEEMSRSFRAFREAQRGLLDQLSAGVAQFDAKKRLTFANQPFQRLFKLPASTLQDLPAFERLLDGARDAGRVPEARDFPAWRREKAAWFASGEASEEAWTLADGTHLRIVAQPVPDGGLMLIAEDRTEQLRLSAVRDTLLRTRTATFDSLFESIAVFAPDGRLQIWNRRFAADWGLDSDFLDTHPHMQDLLKKIAPHLERPAEAETVGGVVRSATLDRMQKGGRIALADGRMLEFAGVPLPDGNGLLAVLDITDSQKAEAALRESNAALIEADTIKTRFLAKMSYELRTPLTSIGGFAELLEAGVGGDLSESGRDYVGAILTSVEQLGDHIDSLLDLSQSEAGLLPLKKEEIDPMPFVRSVVEERASRLQKAGLELDLQASGLLRPISGDRKRLARALGHLVDNAIAASRRGERIRVQLGRRKSGGEEWLQILVQDQGAGMDSRSVALALDGMKASADGKSVERSQGLGLPLARQLVEAHGGALRLVSEPGKGTSALVELP
ncbi:MAG: sensor signal transduction histidine kinase [Novosphingobium lindaniclasticum]|jgi:signal transduction histidine kinase|uniref:sensor histidine kinase n=1 Tax=Novosphingobium lindaniclasticum TaxID=1329895 RepID=UPI002409D93C|nr:PAS domain-containing sensor histidine kinase [Novosphingobium lindaniclasticum]MDF2638245.1 sensor signal transduction histidine kinase [Novosphingobium lindaniclasticum]